MLPDERGRLTVNEHYQTTVPHIYPSGDVIGFPALASTLDGAGPPGRLPRLCLPASSVPALFPYGIYTIPEISMWGAPRRS